MPSDPASAKPWSAALSVCDDVTLTAGSAYPPAVAASRIRPTSCELGNGIRQPPPSSRAGRSSAADVVAQLGGELTRSHAGGAVRGRVRRLAGGGVARARAVVRERVVVGRDGDAQPAGALVVTGGARRGRGARGTPEGVLGAMGDVHPRAVQLGGTGGGGQAAGMGLHAALHGSVLGASHVMREALVAVGHGADLPGPRRRPPATR